MPNRPPNPGPPGMGPMGPMPMMGPPGPMMGKYQYIHCMLLVLHFIDLLKMFSKSGLSKKSVLERQKFIFCGILQYVVKLVQGQS